MGFLRGAEPFPTSGRIKTEETISGATTGVAEDNTRNDKKIGHGTELATWPFHYNEKPPAVRRRMGFLRDISLKQGAWGTASPSPQRSFPNVSYRPPTPLHYALPGPLWKMQFAGYTRRCTRPRPAALQQRTSRASSWTSSSLDPLPAHPPRPA